ncbi:alpha-glucan family phosphorylase [Leptolyngbya sp. FACHB-261]|uniref:alpha-glucan family phosphorylase n=1 Tax=Leptolyngbya sp. FACHB-261 TaxID=2692806 RepID=UPI0016859E60|nr:alpha-glucan family phosphorylase [Leptolyngbya sp. FACHB-261]MBD2103705.1 alpha-glucan family phosphorylase [Leptolyngbya sp. FACHB-261]
MQPIRTFNVTPALPERLEPLRKLAYNLHWVWNVETTSLFRRLDPDLWTSSRHNPVLMLGTISQERLQEAAEDEGFLAQMERAARQFDDYLQRGTWYRKQRGVNAAENECYAYFSAEFGLTDCLPIYSGGLGVLAGDHLKSASDLGLPLVGVGLLYQKGYFSQYLNADGWQQERYPINDFYNLPLHLERNPDGSELRISVDFPGRQILSRVWRVQVGTVPLYLLDTNIELNSQYDQDITDYLYGGDIDLRIHQEMMLGIGGVKMLKALGLNVTAFHMNEGHAAFLGLERIRTMIQEDGLTYDQAHQVAQSSQLFTTHTPVPAGIDLFPVEKIDYYVGHYAQVFGLQKEEFHALGRENPSDLKAPFSMAVLAINMATFINGVAKLHGVVSRSMFKGLWPQLPVTEVPITAVTNGVHARTWVHEDTQDLYGRYLGPRWSDAPPEDELWSRVNSIPDEELWRNHERCRARLVVFARERLQKQLRDRGASPSEIAQAGEVLDPYALTIGFARRFATYKRAALFLRDVDRIKRLLLKKDQPVQFIMAGKAHPKDIPGKELIRQIVHFLRDEGVRARIVFMEDYDMHVARLMVSGCDVWLNTPRRPREASGTSGMKGSMNGLLNLSVLDGWWDEADYVRTGWSIGKGEDYDDPDYQDEVESNALYELLEKEVCPLFYNRGEDGLPRGWVAKMKDAIRLNSPVFNTARMVRDYALQGYFPASDRYHTMTAQKHTAARELASWKAKLFDHWYNIRIEDIDISVDERNPAAVPSDLRVDQSVAVKTRLNLGPLSPDDIQVELYQGSVNETGEIVQGKATPMVCQGTDSQGSSIYTGTLSYTSSGLHGLTVRALPRHVDLSNAYEPRLILWA